MLAQAWAQLKTRSALDAITKADLDALLEQAAEEAVARKRRERPTVLSGRFAAIEKRRLARLAREWLEVEKRRDGFTVLATEDKRPIRIGALAFNARLDRVDATGDGRRIVIDYKTGKASPGAMVGARPDEPQLPLYLVSAEHSESMVWIRSRVGFSATAHPAATSLASTAAASSSVVPSCSLAGALPARAAASASSTRSRISPAALRVKVMATISSGCSTDASNLR